MGTMEGVDNEEEASDSQEQASPWSSDQEEFNTLEFEEYNGFSEDSIDEDRPERTQAMYEQGSPPRHDMTKRESDNEIIYGWPSDKQSAETMKEIPLFEFGGAQLYSPAPPTRMVQMAAATEIRPDDLGKGEEDEPK
ncbi:hypothetical protein EDD85DRAFT_946267 [Armillaria nabsnona]|nr:hypothetical protein EDD85DRAFT_946267 [Armillaria nabsnona]